MTLKIERVDINGLTFDPENPRSHDERNLESIESSLRKFGQVEPLVVQRGTNQVIGGNGRLTAMRKMGWTEADVVFLDVDEREARALSIALNRTGELAGWNEDVLARHLKSLGEMDPTLPMSLGFDAEDLQRLGKLADGPIAGAAGNASAGENDPGPQEAEEDESKVVSRKGDLWIFGRSESEKSHRLMCGSSIEEADVARLMKGHERTVRLLSTDPPYLVDYNGDNHPQSFSAKKNVARGNDDTQNKEWDDYVDPAASVDFFQKFLRLALSIACVPNPAVYQWHASKRQALVEQAWESVGLFVHQQIIWFKSRPILTRSHYMWQHEPAFYGWVKGRAIDLKPDCGGENSTVWQIGQAGENDGIHPTQKPLEIFRKPMRSHTEPGEVCYEPFSGSGSNIMAGEVEGRFVFAMEISPAFVDAALKRWMKATGLEVTISGSGKTYAEVAAERGIKID